MTQNTEATSALEQSDYTAQFAAKELAISPTDDSIRYVADGVWEDPRKDVTGKYVRDHGVWTNVVGKLQHSITIRLADNSTMLVSGFDAKGKKLDGLKLGYTYTFKGIMKTKTEMFLGKEKTSLFLNL